MTEEEIATENSAIAKEYKELLKLVTELLLLKTKS